MMNIKNNIKKLITSLLIVTAFVPLCHKINEDFQNNFTTTFLSSSFNIINHQDIDFVNLSNNVYVEKSLYDQNPNTYNCNAIFQVIENAKRLVKEKTDLDYSENAIIYIVDDNSTKFFKSRETAITHSEENKQWIYIKNKNFFEKKSTALAHEMIHALICSILGDKLNLGIHEGIATQVNNLNDWGNINKIPDKNLLFANVYPDSREGCIKFYHLHQYLIYNWIKIEGKDVIKKYIEKVKNGEDSIEAFYSLRGNKIIEKLSYNTELVS